ncbi:hypothetical protein SHELI_v1c03130 [Spiroplasma helicoides]|uniref:Uncharacterized protein n=1 Tax=Spiroplasma helicoides TaxID=216938 RepID=A0A1B3SK20_9MOLU|nr:hypothetical protein [Spiroplasma helicoides]AOG60268.1 hypothetical protein SHELI_v1c03130 [Spiroplasma helicoides]
MFLADGGLGSLFGGGATSGVIIGVIVLVIIVFIVVSSITSKKAQKKEQAKRKKVVKEEIKMYLAAEKKLKNIKIEYEKVYARKGPEYKYRDVFDVIVQIFEPKTNDLIQTSAYEVEGITTRADKKTYTTAWQVNGELDLDETKKRIAIAEKKIKLSKDERKVLKIEEVTKAKEQRDKLKQEQQKLKEQKAQQKSMGKTIESARIDETIKSTAVKFVPKRNK